MSPFTDWVQALAAHLHDRHGTPVGVIGMCMTGGIVLAALPHRSIGAGVSAQPAFPWARQLGNTSKRRASIGLSESEQEVVCGDATPLKVFRFEHDPTCPDERIAAIEACFSQAIPASSITEPVGLEGKLHPTLTAAFRPGMRHNGDVEDLSLAAVEEASVFLLENLSPT